VARRCSYDIMADPSKANTSACADINAGTLHVLLTNQLASNVGFVIDRDRSIQVWNQPLWAFSSSQTSSTPRPDGGASVQLQVTVTYGKERVPMWNPYPTYSISETYVYHVELDVKGNIIGGDHITWDRPDFAWRRHPLGPFYGYFSGLQQLYSKSTNSTSVTRALKGSAKSATHKHFQGSKQELKFVQVPEDKQRRHTFSIAPVQGASTVLLRFEDVNVQKNFQSIKVYEGEEGDGALVAVISRPTKLAEVEVRSYGGAFIVFNEDRTAAVSHIDEDHTASFRMSYRSM